ncbi:hypothetical protein BC834DRAFT_839874 [Gloeopeniophorella convolvens]|nr:hypothetical protein BC834DRAFT_839874 [Gloeopeniophorella convolvens]
MDPESDSEASSEGSHSGEEEGLDDGSGGDVAPRQDDSRTKEPKRGPAVVARKGKNAPTEVTSKRPVSRRRTVVEVQKMEVRDPRFQPLTGEFDASRFQDQYKFLSDVREGELKTLRENLSRARKLLASSPRDLRPEREHEVERLSLAVKRAESSVNRDKRERAEQAALSAVGKEERDKRKQGKKAYWMKDAEKKKVMLKARYDVVATEGGKRAVKKAIEKKRKKLSQKETKSRPFPRATGSTSAPTLQPPRKRAAAPDGVPAKKRQKYT